MRPNDWHVLDLDGDPVPGDPSTVDEIARGYAALATQADQAALRVRAVSADDTATSWAGRSGDAFRSQIGELPHQLEKVRTSYRLAARALTSYAHSLRTAQADADRALAAGRRAAERLGGARLTVRAAAGDRDRASAALADALGMTAITSVPGRGVTRPPLPDPSAITVAVRDQRAAQNRLAQATASLAASRGEWDAARRLALAARDLRADAETRAVHDLRRASHAGIRNAGWFAHLTEKLASAWHVTVAVCKVAGLVLAVAGLVLSGPLLETLFAATALVVLADALLKYHDGHAGPFDVALAAAALLPVGRLARGEQVAARLGSAARVLRGATPAGRTVVRAFAAEAGPSVPAWRQLVVARAELISSAEAPVVEGVAAAAGRHLDQLSASWPGMDPAERNLAIGTIYRDIRQQMRAPLGRCEPKLMAANRYGYAGRAGNRYFVQINNNLGIEDTVSTIVHETRHSFQLGQAAGHVGGRPGLHPDARDWHINFHPDNYAPPEADFARYRGQPVELDADALEHLVGRILGRSWPKR